jgi:hypothetical protein
MAHVADAVLFTYANTLLDHNQLVSINSLTFLGIALIASFNTLNNTNMP